jgi:hypothetical protein
VRPATLTRNQNGDMPTEMSWAATRALNWSSPRRAAMIETAKSTRRAGVSLYESPRNTTLTRKKNLLNLPAGSLERSCSRVSTR